jgi:hypothetical protein
VGGQGKTELCRQILRDKRVQGCLVTFHNATIWIDDELSHVWEVAIWHRLLVSLGPAMNTDRLKEGIPVPPVRCFNAVLETVCEALEPQGERFVLCVDEIMKIECVNETSQFATMYSTDSLSPSCGRTRTFRTRHAPGRCCL